MRSLLACLLIAAPAAAEVVRVEIERREVVLAGQAFGKAGAYEKLTGVVHFAFDPENSRNARIVDIALAPRNADGFVEADANFMALQPVDPEKRSGTALVEVSNRGGKAALSYFNRARSSADPESAAHFGDGFLMEQGLTVLWVGWQFDVPAEDGRLRLNVPVASGPEGHLTGLVRSDWTLDAAVASLDVAHRNHRPYPVLDRADKRNILTVRDGRLAAREVVQRAEWSFGRSGTSIQSKRGFEAGKIYELVYVAADPRVVGLGLAAIRDVIAYAKHDDEAVFPVQRGIAVGISQTGRFLRHFLYQGFNTDEAQRQAYDGMLIHTAGAGRGSFNHRFAQPSRDGHRYSAFFYPTDLFPFSSASQSDPATTRTAGLFDAEQHVPKVFATNTGYEYWGRAASLLHTTIDGGQDLSAHANERIYHLRAGQHFVARFPPAPNARQGAARVWLGNPLDFLVTERALLSALLQWVEEDTPPPASAVPRIAAGELVSIDKLAFPEMPGLVAPRVIHEAYRVDYGSTWPAGVITKQPPVLGRAFPALVARVDRFGNETTGVPTLETLAPLATYTPWSLRRGLPGEQHELADFRGYFAPLARNEAERLASGDTRASIAAIYASRAAYMALAEQAAEELVDARFLLMRDVERVVQRAADTWDWIMDER